MANKAIPDWKKAVIVAASDKYGYRALGRKLGINFKTVRKYKKLAEDEGELQMTGINLEAK